LATKSANATSYYHPGAAIDGNNHFYIVRVLRTNGTIDLYPTGKFNFPIQAGTAD
jgi:hypothetical protein